ncbi:anthranilate synthase component I [Methylophilaceae bacterium]|nr:anthranilate synthase component I [Methylophilaceae bacterium]
MEINLSKEQFLIYQSEGYNRIPLVKTCYADLETPLSIFLKVANSPYSYLLESVEGGENFGRYSIIGMPAKKLIQVRQKTVEIIESGKTIFTENNSDPLGFIDQYLGNYKIPENLDLPRFSGGLAGYFGYETIHYIEPKLIKEFIKDDLDLPDIHLMESDEVIVFDNLTGKLSIVVYANDDLSSYEHAINRLTKIELMIESQLKNENAQSKKNIEETLADSEFGEKNFHQAVNKIKEYIVEGDVMQVVLSQRMVKKFQLPAISLYRVLRSINPSPYMFFYHFDDYFIVGASPEILVRLENDSVTVRPIAGTRPRGENSQLDKALEKDLLNDPKEIAEHIQLMDLGRNDIGRVSQPGSVSVTDKMTIERYSHVMHIVSNVEGLIQENLSPMDVLKATFPAGTVSGAPKVRAMEIINELESTKRGVYAGAVGYIGYDGTLDVAIAIRTGVIKSGKLYVQAGAGVVADSIAKNEWDETNNKAKAVLRAAEIAEKDFG